MFETTSYASKFIVKANDAKQLTTKTKVAKFVIKKLVIAKFVIAKFVIAKYIAQKFIIVKHIAQKSFAIIVRLLNNIYNNIIFNTKNLFRNRTTFIFILMFNSYNIS